MPSALTVAQKQAVFEALEIPWNNGTTDGTVGFYTTDGVGGIAQRTSISNSTLAQTQLQLLTFLDNLNTNQPQQETVLISYTARWIVIGTQKVKMENGSVGHSVTGIYYNFEDERLELKKRIQSIVPFFRAHEVDVKQNIAVLGDAFGVFPIMR